MSRSGRRKKESTFTPSCPDTERETEDREEVFSSRKRLATQVHTNTLASGHRAAAFSFRAFLNTDGENERTATTSFCSSLFSHRLSTAELNHCKTVTLQHFCIISANVYCSTSHTAQCSTQVSLWTFKYILMLLYFDLSIATLWYFYFYWIKRSLRVFLPPLMSCVKS